MPYALRSTETDNHQKLAYNIRICLPQLGMYPTSPQWRILHLSTLYTKLTYTEKKYIYIYFFFIYLLFTYLFIYSFTLIIYLLYENLFQPMPDRHASTPRKENWEKGRKGKGSRHVWEVSRSIPGRGSHKNLCGYRTVKR